MRLTNKFAERFKELRLEKGKSQEQVAVGLGYAQSTIAGWERGAREPRLDDLMAICNYFKVSMDYLSGMTD